MTEEIRASGNCDLSQSRNGIVGLSGEMLADARSMQLENVSYSAPKGWYGTHYVSRLSKELPEDTLRQMHGYYEKLLRKYPDVVTVKDVVALTGYTLTTVHNWCSRGSLKAFQKGLKFCIPKIFLVDFFCSLTFRSITRKSLWHIQTLNEFSRKMKRK